MDDTLNVGVSKNQHSLRLLSQAQEQEMQTGWGDRKKISRNGKKREETREMRSQDLCLANILSAFFSQ